MAGRHLLDTNIVIALWGGDAAVKLHFDRDVTVFLSSVVLGELHFGAAKSARPDENAARIEEFAQSCALLSLDADSARLYAEIKAGLTRLGRPIPDNDIWIAASARQHDLILATRDHTSHPFKVFRSTPGRAPAALLA